MRNKREYKNQIIIKIFLFLFYVFCVIKKCSALIEEIEATPTNSNGMEIGELSTLQFVILMLLFLKMTLLYAMGVLPLEIDLGCVYFDDCNPTNPTGRKVSY